MLKALDEQGFIEKLAEKVYSKSISSLLLKILTLESQIPEFCLGVRSKILTSVLRQLTSSNLMSHCFCSEIVGEFLVRYKQANSWRELLEVITRSDNLRIIFDSSISGEESRIVAGVRIIGGMIRCGACSYLWRETRNSDDDTSGVQEEREEKSSELVKGLVQAMQGYAVILRRASEKFIGTSGAEIERLGMDRKSIVELILSCIWINVREINREIARTEALTMIFGFFFKFEMNSILQNLVGRIIVDMLTYLDEDDCLIDCLVQSQFISSLANPTLHKGYNGHATKIANFLVKIKEKHKKIAEAISACANWENFYLEYLIKTNAIENKSLGGAKPVKKIRTSNPKSMMTSILNEASSSDNISKVIPSGYSHKSYNSDESMNELEIEEDFESDNPGDLFIPSDIDQQIEMYIDADVDVEENNRFIDDSPEIEEDFEPDHPGDLFMPSDFDPEIKMDINADLEENHRYIDHSSDILEEKNIKDWNFTQHSAYIKQPKFEEISL